MFTNNKSMFLYVFLILIFYTTLLRRKVYFWYTSVWCILENRVWHMCVQIYTRILSKYTIKYFGRNNQYLPKVLIPLNFSLTDLTQKSPQIIIPMWGNSRKFVPKVSSKKEIIATSERKWFLRHACETWLFFLFYGI